jgi:predicted nucleic acid-binding protein
VKVFLDTSALAKRYVAEQGSDQVLAVCQQADSLVVSVICLPELVSTLCRLVREEKLASAAYRTLKGSMMADLADVDICEITQEVLASVVSLLELHPLRAMDGLHVACAHACAPDAFVSADHRQLSAARKAGLSVIDVS